MPVEEWAEPAAEVGLERGLKAGQHMIHFIVQVAPTYLPCSLS